MTRADRRKKWKGQPWYQKWGFADWRDIILLAIALFGAWAYWHDHNALLEMREQLIEDPCYYCDCGVVLVDDAGMERIPSPLERDGEAANQGFSLP